MSMDISYKTIPPLAAYIDRIGAEQLNIRRFMIKNYLGNYYVEKVLIKITDEGEITCSDKEHAPTEKEAALIKAALSSIQFPRTIHAPRSKLDDLKKLIGPGAKTYEFLDRSGDVVMVQERTMRGGSKVYLPWTFWSDGTWRCMEPDGPLPFWKPSPEKRRARIMIHEGAKAAKAVNEMLEGEGKENHPWGEWLDGYEHWGMIGGSLAPHRTNYDELRREKPTEVVYVCDNDFPGNLALQEVSRCYGGRMKGMRFDPQWKESWDMADPMPKHLFAKGGRYVGPHPKNLLKFATWATEIVPQKGSGRPTMKISYHFKEEWYHSVSPEVFIHKDWPNRMLDSGEFNSHVRPFSDADDTARLLRRDDSHKTCLLQYTPSNKPGIFTSEQGLYINTHVGTSIVSEKGDAGPWTEFMEHLIPVESDRIEVYRWIATLITMPENKIRYGLLLISETQGVGKGTLCEKILAKLMGNDNVSYPSEEIIVNSTFNEWKAHKRLAVVHEIYAGHSAKAYNKLKDVITDDHITVNKKFMPNYVIANWLHIAACSNSTGALRLSSDDRRWLVPKVTEEKKDHGWWMQLNSWLSDENGLGIISNWCREFLKKHPPVLTGEPAPWTTVKREIIEESYSPGMQLASDIFRRMRDVLDGEYPDTRAKMEKMNMIKDGEAIIRDTDVISMIKAEVYNGSRHDFMERPRTIRKVAKAEGWWPTTRQTKLKNWGSNYVKPIFSSKALSERKIDEICGEEVAKEERIIPVDLNVLMKPSS